MILREFILALVQLVLSVALAITVYFVTSPIDDNAHMMLSAIVAALVVRELVLYLAGRFDR